MPEHTDIKWVKNVKREDGTDWAYMDAGFENEFPLNFSDSQLPNARELQEGEIILLFQKVDRMPGVRVATYLTHLVTPLDDQLSFLGDGSSFPYIRRVGVIARANNVYSNPKTLSFQNPNSGKVYPIGLLNRRISETQLTRTIWQLFEGHFNPGFADFRSMITDAVTFLEPELFSGLEGREKEILRKHLVRERNPRLVAAAKRRALARDGVLRCEACNFIFGDIYGDHGADFIECHHKMPIAEGGERDTTLDDLALLCANCHRMLHRRNANREYYTVEQLRTIIRRNAGGAQELGIAK